MQNQWISFAASIVFLTSGVVQAGLVLEKQVPPAIARLQLQPIGRVPDSTRLNLDIALPLRNPQELSEYLRDLYNPGSANFHHYLKPEEFTRRFGPTASDYEAVAAFARNQGLTVTGRHPNRLLLDVSAPAATAEKVFHVHLLNYHHPTENRDFYAPDQDPTLDLTVPVLRVGGLDNYGLPRPLVQVEKNHPATGPGGEPEAGSATNGNYIGDDFRAAYVPGVSLTGAGQIVGLLEFDGYFTNDIAEYENQAGLSNVALANVLLDGFNGTPTNLDANVEVSLDIEDAIAMAPGVSEVIVYEAGENGSWHDILNRMADDNLADQMSSSWFIPDGGPDPVADQIFQQMAAQGQSFFQASGDRLAYNGLIPFPCDNPYITLVGGTELSTTGPAGAWESETVWHSGAYGSGGGVSTNYSIPFWQQAVNMGLNQGSAAMRNVPDVGLTATHVYVVANNGVEFSVSGTSCAAPLWAGFTALVNQQSAALSQASAGFLNPALYAIGVGTNYSAAFHDVVTGNNTNANSHGRFLAVAGYDLCTGWGTPAGQNLIDALTSPTQPGPPSITYQPQSRTIAYGGAADLYVGATGSFPLSFQWSFNGTNIAYSTNAWLLLTNCVPAQSGTYAVLVSNSQGVALSSNAVLAVEPPAPPTITSQPASQMLDVGATASFSITATGTAPLFYQWLFDGTNLANATNSALSLSNVQLTEAGVYSVQVSNAAGPTNSSEAWLTLTPGWQASAAPEAYWSSVASSSDGTKLAACASGGYIYTSTNSGYTWTKSGSVSAKWSSIASSMDGSRLVASVSGGGIYTSANAGDAWKETSAPDAASWVSAASSSNGLRLLALKKITGGFDDPPIYISTNAGTNWSSISLGDFSCPLSWSALACSANAATLVASVDNGPIYVSTASGSSWTETSAVSNAWSSVACSADGSKMIAVAHTGPTRCDQDDASVYSGPVFISANSGGTWTETSAPTNNWNAAACSASGTTIAIVASNGPIYISTNAGATWFNTGAPGNSWNAVASSSDGTHWVAVAGTSASPALIYTWQSSLNLELTRVSSSNGLVFAWPAYWSGAVLMQTTNLAAGRWLPAGGQATETNGQIQVTLPNSAGSYFYRLAYP